jgi:hypothetical protein
MPEYWAQTWLDSERIKTVGGVISALGSPAVIKELKESAQLVIESWKVAHINPRPESMVAGAGIDLSGRLDCNATKCRRAQVDRLFRRAWHYFETIIARDAIAEDLVVHRNCPDEEVRRRLVPHFETLLIVREFGAEALVEFLPRVPACSQHWKQHATEAGIGDIAAGERKVVNQLIADSDITLQKEKGGAVCTINNPDFSHTQWIHFSGNEIEGRSEKQITRAAVRRVMHTFLAHLTSDIEAARKYGGSFASTIPIFQKLLANRGPEIGNVAFEIDLPILDGLSTAQLIDVRLKYQETFVRFRKRLGSFLEDCIRQGVSDPENIRHKLRTDLIEGEAEELKSYLKNAQLSLKKKSAYALTLGSLVATIGVATGIVAPPAAFGLLATVSATSMGAGVSKYVDDMARIKSDDMYFLLQAESHSH